MSDNIQDNIFVIAGGNIPTMSYRTQEWWYINLCSYVLDESGKELTPSWLIDEDKLPGYYNKGLQVLKEFRDEEASVSR